MKTENEKIEKGISELSYDDVRILTGNIEMSESAKRRVYNAALKKSGISPSSRPVSGEGRPLTAAGRKIRLEKPVAAAVAVMLALSIGVGSIVGAGQFSKTFGQYFVNLPDENYRDIVFDINQSVTDNGVTVTLTQGMCDGICLYLIERIEFAPSVATLTDDLFELRDGGYNAPYPGTELITQSGRPEYGETERGDCKLLEHDAHSMTWLRVFGGHEEKDMTSDFFREGTGYLLTVGNIENLPGREDSYPCSFRFEFEIKLTEPVVYHLPEGTYTYDRALIESCNEEFPHYYDGYPDVWITPWFMEIAAASLTGKVLNTNLRTDAPALVITMNDGRVYSDKHGIGWAGYSTLTRDMFGADYNQYEGFYLTFNDEIDVTAIKSIKLYGRELVRTKLPDKTDR